MVNKYMVNKEKAEMVTIRSIRTAVVLPLVCVLCTGPVLAHANPPVHRSFIHRHPHMATAGAGIAGYAYAKHRRSGFMHRHPVMTGVAAAAVTHHYAKKRN